MTRTIPTTTDHTRCTGLTIARRGGGYSPVCLVCGCRLRIVVALRSTALALLEEHHRDTHGWTP